MTYIPLIPNNFFNVKSYGAKCDGVTDDTSFVQAAIADASAAGGGYVFLPGISAISAPLTLSTNKVWLVGAGAGTGLKALAGFSGAELVSINTADWCGVRDMILYGGPNTSSSTNPAITAAIEITSSRLAGIWNCEFYYINGWCIESVGGASVNNVGSKIFGNHAVHCAQGLHIKGASGSNYVGQMQIVGNLFETIDNGDLLFLEDINDCQIVGIGGAVAGGAVSGAGIHVKGGASNTIMTIDVGMISTGTTSPTILVETSANSGDPNNISFIGGEVQSGNYGIQITAANNVMFQNLTIFHNNLDGVNMSGALSGLVHFGKCHWKTNNQANGTAYELNTNQTTSFVYVNDCTFGSQVAGGVAGSVTNVINDVNHRTIVTGGGAEGSGTTASNIFAGTAQYVRNFRQYNPRGGITAPTITASPFTTNTSQNDVHILFTAINNLTQFTVNGVNYGVPVANVDYFVPARASVVLTYGATPPTWIWSAN